MSRARLFRWRDERASAGRLNDGDAPGRVVGRRESLPEIRIEI